MKSQKGKYDFLHFVSCSFVNFLLCKRTFGPPIRAPQAIIVNNNEVSLQSVRAPRLTVEPDYVVSASYTTRTVDIFGSIFSQSEVEDLNSASSICFSATLIIVAVFALVF